MFGIDDAFGLLMEFSAHLGWFIVMLPTMFLYLYKRHIVKIFFHLGAISKFYQASDTEFII